MSRVKFHIIFNRGMKYMDTKICTKCSIEKSLEEFTWKSKKNNKRNTKCKPCLQAYNAEWYKRNPFSQRNATKRYRQSTYENLLREKFEYLAAHPCVDCGESNPLKLTFDHIDPSTKTNNISTMIAFKTYSWDAILGEISKCEVRCGSCHLFRTHKQFNTQCYQMWSQQES